MDVCRPIVGLDDYFLKGKYGGAILSAISLDGNNGLFPVAIYVSRGEDTDSWTDFLRFLKPHLLKHKNRVTFMSDRCKGLIEAVHDLFPDSRHRHCMRHLYKNFQAKFKGDHLMHLSWGAASSYREEDYNKWIKQMEKDDVKAYQYLQEADPHCWSRSFMDTGTKCEHLTNNFSESFNSMIIKLRDMPLVKLIQNYQLMVMALLYKRRSKAEEELGSEIVVPRVKKLIDKYKKEYKAFTTKGSTDWQHVAIDTTGATWTVDLKAQTCSCRQWEVSGIPCMHAIAVILPRREQWERYVSPYMSVDSYKAAYESHINPIDDIQFCNKPTEIVNPPPMYREPGRPRYNRMKPVDECGPQKNSKKRCGKCGILGHNSKTCKGLQLMMKMEEESSLELGPQKDQMDLLLHQQTMLEVEAGEGVWLILVEAGVGPAAVQEGVGPAAVQEGGTTIYGQGKQC